jgi:hypothetical protein
VVLDGRGPGYVGCGRHDDSVSCEGVVVICRSLVIKNYKLLDHDDDKAVFNS